MGGKVKDFLSTAISKNDQLIKLDFRHPSKTPVTEDLVLWLKEASETQHKYVIRVRLYMESLTEPQCTSKKLKRKRRLEVQIENEIKLKLAQQKHQLELSAKKKQKKTF